MKYPKEVLAKAKGKEEARVLIDRGKFVRYRYIDTATGKASAKYTLLLNNGKEIGHYFIVPMKGKELVVKRIKESKKRKLWDKEKKKIVSDF